MNLVYSFVVKLKKNPLPNADRYANELQRKYDEVRERFEVYGSASGMNHRWSDQDFDEAQQWAEAWLCRELYQSLFAQPGSEDFLHDEQLQAKIAALNFLDLTLEHLGFVLEHHEDVAHIAQVVREGGVGKCNLRLECFETDGSLCLRPWSLNDLFPPPCTRDAKASASEVAD